MARERGRRGGVDTRMNARAVCRCFHGTVATLIRCRRCALYAIRCLSSVAVTLMRYDTRRGCCYQDERIPDDTLRCDTRVRNMIRALRSERVYVAAMMPYHDVAFDAVTARHASEQIRVGEQHGVER